MKIAAMLTTLVLSLVAPPGIAAEHDVAADPMRTPARCVDGDAITTTPGGLPLVVGPCSTDARAPAAPPASPPVAQDGPEECALPGYDDRCEAWAAPRYDGAWRSADYPGFGSFDRHTTILPHPTLDLVFVGGTSAYTNGGLPDADFVEIAYRASTGQPVWTATYAGYEERTLAYQHSIALSPDGRRIYAIGSAAEPGVYQYATIVVAFDALLGTRLWDVRAPISADAVEAALTGGPGGAGEERVYLGGVASTTSSGGGPVVGGAVAALDADDGRTVWTAAFAGDTPRGARFNEIVVSPDGSTVYAGGGEHADDGLARNFMTAAFRATDGERLWVARDERTQPSTGNNGISDMVVTPDGRRVLVTGFDSVRSTTIGVPSTSAILTVAHETGTGEVAWRDAYGGPVAGETHFYFSLFQGMMDISPDGSTAVVTAAINSHNATGTAAYDVATGARRWGVESPEHGYVFTNYLGYYPAVAVSDTGAFVSNRRGIGYSQYRTVTTAYALDDGALEWTARVGTNRTLFGGNVLAPDGRRLFVTAADQVANVGFPVPDPGIDTVDVVTYAYDAAPS